MILNEPLRRRVHWGIGHGLAVAVAFSAWAVIVVGIIGGGRAFEEYGIALPQVLAVYLAGGFVGGAVFGALAPLGRTRLGALLAGVAVLLPVYTMSTFLAAGVAEWRVGVGGGLILATFVGGPCGLIYRDLFRGDLSRARRVRARLARKRALKAYRRREYAEVVRWLERVGKSRTVNDERRLSEARSRLNEPLHAG